jgi:DNA-binding transcriptional MerR regulator
VAREHDARGARENAERLRDLALSEARAGELSENPQDSIDSSSVLWELAEDLALAGRVGPAQEVAGSIRNLGKRQRAIAALEEIASGHPARPQRCARAASPSRILDLAPGGSRSVGGVEVSRQTVVMSETDRLMSIGEFSKRSWLSPKALRLYERLGLLVPAHVGEDNGYRSYRESQLETARLIAMLRRLDMPLTEVARVVAVPGPEAAALIQAFWESTERSIASQRVLAAHLQVQLSGDEGGYEMFEVRERDVPEQLVLTEQRHIRVPELSDWLGSTIGRLVRTAQEHGGVGGDVFVIYHGAVNEDSDGPVEVCVPIVSGHESPDVAMRREPAHREAYTRITKAQVEFPQILSAYDAVASWIGPHDCSIAGSPREVYFADFDAAGPDDMVCDIAFPVE